MADVDCNNNVTYLEDYGVDISSVYLDIGPYARIGKSKKEDIWHLFDPVEMKKKLECQSDETRWQVRMTIVRNVFILIFRHNVHYEM